MFAHAWAKAWEGGSPFCDFGRATKGTTDSDDDDDDDDEGECGTPPDAETTTRSDDDEKDVDSGLAIAPASFSGSSGLLTCQNSGLSSTRTESSSSGMLMTPTTRGARGSCGSERGPSKADLKQCPSANAIAKFDFGAVACELSTETYGVEQKWALLRKLG